MFVIQKQDIFLSIPRDKNMLTSYCMSIDSKMGGDDNINIYMFFDAELKSEITDVYWYVGNSLDLSDDSLDEKFYIFKKGRLIENGKIFRSEHCEMLYIDQDGICYNYLFERVDIW